MPCRNRNNSSCLPPNQKGNQIMEIQELIDALNFTLNTSCGNLTPQTIDLIVDRIHELKEQLQALKIPQKPT